jgi:hypothetical protein
VLAARRVRSISSKQGQRLRNVGGALFKAVFAGEILQCYLRSLGSCTEGTGLRIRLRFADTPELVNLPWELLFDEGIDQWVALKLDTPLVRYLRMPAQIAPLRVSGPLHVLTVVSDPSDVPHLDIDSEAAAVEGALRLLDESSPGSVVAQTLRHPTPELLQRKLMELPWHVLHFIGHGEFDERTGTGLLVLEDENGKARPITAERLSVMLQGRSLKLVILNSCEGSRGGEDHRSGLAQSLIAQGVPAVIAMQFPITDTAALAFSRMFYHAVVLGTSLENAVVEARRAIFQESELEWATPTLYLRSENGLLFERFEAAGGRKALEPQEPRNPEQSRSPHESGAAELERLRLATTTKTTTTIDPVPPPDPWWKRRFVLPGAVLGVAVIAVALSRLAPGPAPEPSPEPSSIATAFVATTAGPSAAPARLSSAQILQSLAANPISTIRPASTGVGSTCPMPGASVRDTFETDTHLWDPLPRGVTIGKGYLIDAPAKGRFQQVLHVGSMSDGSVCTTFYMELNKSGPANSDLSAAGLAFWYTADRLWAFFATPSGKFRIQHFDFKAGKWTIVVPATYSAQIRRGSSSSLFSNLYGILGGNVLTVRLAGGVATFYINGAKVDHVSGGPTGRTWSGVIAETAASEPQPYAWHFGYYGVAR